MSDPAGAASSEEQELMQRAKAIADGRPRSASAGPDEASSPALRRMAILAEVAEAFTGAGTQADEDRGEPPLFIWGSLEVRRLVGEGSFGEVYEAWDPRLRRQVALKLRREDAGGSTRRWLDEARAQAKVRHPNVVTVYGADEFEGRAGMWTDLVKGRDLEAILQQQGPFSEREARSIGLELCGALAAVHARGLVHGDVKTRNVMREDGGDTPGRIVLMDFGSAHEASLAVTAGRGSSAGTPLAMAPEVLRGEPATAASDLYSLGVLLFRLVTGRYPVEAASLDELRQKHERGERGSLRALRPGLPRRFVQVVEQALEPDPRLRHSGAADLERALQDARSPLWFERPRALVALAILVVILGLAPWLFRERWAGPALDHPVASAPRGEGLAPPSAGAGGPSRDVTSLDQPPGADARTPMLQAEATLFRIRVGEAAPLVTGGEIEPGDRLYVSLSAPEKVSAYVLDEDGAGRVIALFPCVGAGANNPLEAGTTHRLPGAAEQTELNWLVTSAEGRETFLIVVSRKPLDALEATVTSLPRVSGGARLQYATVDEGDLRRLRGVSRLTRDPAAKPPETPGRLAAIARDLGAGPDAPDLWVRLIEVSNPRH